MAGELPVEFPVGGDTVGLDVDEELEGCAVVRVHAAVAGADQGAQRFEVERGERAARVESGGLVRDEQLTVDEEDVRLDAGEPVREGVVEGAGVEIVVVRVGVPEGPGTWAGPGRAPDGGRGRGGHSGGSGDHRGGGGQRDGEGAAAGRGGQGWRGFHGGSLERSAGRRARDGPDATSMGPDAPDRSGTCQVLA